MSNAQDKKSPYKSTNLWTGIATLVAAGFAYFAIAPDAVSAGILADEAHRVVDSIATKNYAVLIAAIVNAANILYHLFKK